MAGGGGGWAGGPRLAGIAGLNPPAPSLRTAGVNWLLPEWLPAPGALTAWSLRAGGYPLLYPLPSGSVAGMRTHNPGGLAA